MERRFGLSIVVAAVACGSPAKNHPADGAGPTDGMGVLDGPTDSPPDASSGKYVVARSGARLKLHWYQTPDGSEYPLDGFYDSVLGVNCTPQPWTDGTTRCTPPMAQTAPGIEYLDASCTMPVISTSTAPPAGIVYEPITQPPGSCGHYTIDDTYVAGAQYTPPAVYHFVGPNCVPDVAPSNQFYPLIEKPGSTYVTVTSAYDATGSVQQMHWDSPDGMKWFRAEGNDSVLGAHCTYDLDSDVFDATAARCDPRSGTADGYSNSTCTTAVLSRPNNCAPPAYVGPPSTCGGTTDIVAVGTMVSYPSGVYVPPTCSFTSPQQPSDLYSYYAVGSTSVGTVQAMTRDRDTTVTTRLQPIFLNTAGGVHYQTDIFWDTVLNIQCALTPYGCWPIATRTVFTLYSDSSCTVPFDATEVIDSASCSTHVPVGDFAVKSVGNVQEFHRVTTEHTAQKYQLTSACRPYPEGGSILDRVYDVDPTATPMSAFQSTTVIVDP